MRILSEQVIQAMREGGQIDLGLLRSHESLRARVTELEALLGEAKEMAEFYGSGYRGCPNAQDWDLKGYTDNHGDIARSLLTKLDATMGDKE